MNASVRKRMSKEARL